MNLPQEWSDFKHDTRLKFLILFPWLIAPLAVLLLISPESIFLNHVVIVALSIRLLVSK